MRQGQQAMILRRIPVGKNAGIPRQWEALLDKARLLATDALMPQVPAGEFTAALPKGGTQEFYAVLLAPMPEVDIQAARNNHDGIASRLVPIDASHCLRAQDSGQEFLGEASAMHFQLLHRYAPETKEADGCAGGDTRDKLGLVAKD